MTSDPSFPPPWSELSVTARRLGRGLTEEEVKSLGDYADLLLTWNHRINLTGARALADVVLDHFPDAVALAGLVPERARLIDVGSGGGLPGIPFALLRPDCKLLLIEPRAKRVAFLRTAVRDLALHERVGVLHGRAEDMPATAIPAGPGPLLAGSRATFPPAEWLPLGRKLVGPQGAVVVMGVAAVDLADLGPAERLVPYRVSGGRDRVIGLYSGA